MMLASGLKMFGLWSSKGRRPGGPLAIVEENPTLGDRDEIINLPGFCSAFAAMAKGCVDENRVVGVCNVGTCGETAEHAKEQLFADKGSV
jgi:hypothetical protein